MEVPTSTHFCAISLANCSGNPTSSSYIYVRISRTRYLIVLFQQFCVGRYLPSLTTPATRILQCSSFTAPIGLMSPQRHSKQYSPLVRLSILSTYSSTENINCVAQDQLVKRSQHQTSDFMFVIKANDLSLDCLLQACWTVESYKNAGTPQLDLLRQYNVSYYQSLMSVSADFGRVGQIPTDNRRGRSSMHYAIMLQRLIIMTI